MDTLLLPSRDLDQGGQEVDHVGSALLRADVVGQLTELGQGGPETPTGAVFLDFLVQLHLLSSIINIRTALVFFFT